MVGVRSSASTFSRTPTMTREQKVIRGKVGLLELAKLLSRKIPSTPSSTKRSCQR